MEVMWFSSTSFEGTMTRLSQSVAAGILIPIIIFVVVFLTDSGDSMLPLVERHPFAWVLFWPDLIWGRVLNSDAALIGTALTNVVLCTSLTFVFLRWRGKRGHLL